MYETGKVYISKKVNVYDLLDDGDDTALKKLFYHIDQKDVLAFESKEFQPKFLRDLRSDLTQLKYLRDMWAEVTVDPKLAEFRNQLGHSLIKVGFAGIKLCLMLMKPVAVVVSRDCLQKFHYPFYLHIFSH
jgi:hypothetical protein